MSKQNIRKYNRSGNATCEICSNKGLLERHHINGRTVSRAEEPWNIAWICPNCHEDVHSGLIIIELRQQGLLIWHFKNEPSLTGQDAKPHIH